MVDPDGRKRYNRALKWVRRIHMYLGLFMIPSILLYGITGFLFNHPSTFSDHEIRAVGPEAIEGTALEQLPPPDEVARQVLARLAQVEPKRTADFRLVDPERARYVHDADKKPRRQAL